MKNVTFKRMLALTLASAMILTACGQEPANTGGNQGSESKETSVSGDNTPKDPVRISLYPKDAKLFSGVLGGYRGDVLAEHGIELEIWAYSTEKTNGMLTTGDFPDMMYIAPGSGDILETLIETDKIINYDDYAEYLPHVLGDEVHNEYITPNLDVCRNQFSAGTGGLYVLPFGVGRSTSYYNVISPYDRNTPKIKWDVYEAIGAPEVTNMWDLIDVVEQMLKKQPYAADGTKMHGTYLDNSDTNYFNSLTLWMTWHGSNIADTQYMGERDIATGEVNYILENDSLFKEGLQWLNEMYLRGLIDPDSISTSRTDQSPKIDNAYAMLPAGSLPGYAPNYFEIFPEDCTLYRSDVTETYTGGTSIVIFKDSKNIEACLEFVDLLADSNEYAKLYYGPEGCIWEEENGVISITDEFADWLKEYGSINNFPMPDGTEYSIFNTTALVLTGTPRKGYKSVDGGDAALAPTSLPDAQVITSASDNFDAWKKTMDAENPRDYVAKNKITHYTKSPFDGVSTPKAGDKQSLTIASLKDTIVTACWKMVYAESEVEFEKIWAQMVEDAEIQGAEEIYSWYKENFRAKKN